MTTVIEPNLLDRAIVCPLCPLMCDDVELNQDGRLRAEHCEIANQFHSGENRGKPDSVRGNWSRRPLRIITTGTDLVLARHLAAWHSQGKITLTIETDRCVAAMLATVSRDGIVSATLAEVRAHCDSIGFFGDVESTYPRIGQKLSLERFEPASIKRWFRVDAEELARQFVELASASPQPLRDSNYTAVLVGPDAFVEGEEAITSSMISRWVRKRNENTRTVCVTLDPAATLRSVCLWTNNTIPGSESFQSDSEQHFDIRLGSPLNRQSNPADWQIGGVDPGASLAKVFSPASQAGIDHASMMIRGDGSVSLPLVRKRDQGLTTPSAMLASELDRLKHCKIDQ
ncbi:formylmethanofuran dehydrogenase [Neorhodopirellula pilleata]|uniref:Formylmethanofuran dehydrogenase subunit B n=1 Tax=Neorhodopirellula pilleata TaxID=2714738 RepID=A0A5C6A8V8_9BACT|nr:formylmethanofuran dehydrogenase [Neorhodopirellula pilleata]TWT96424.1 hypothetical protein Pla100_29040 [Neorhodopirellula pilleata]